MPATIHLRTFAAGALFTLACVVGSAMGSPTPSTHGVGGGVLSQQPLAAPSGPSVQQKVAALSARLDRLQVREADTRRIAQAASSIAQDAEQVTGCISSAIYLQVDPDTGAFIEADQADPEGDYVPTLDRECVSS